MEKIIDIKDLSIKYKGLQGEVFAVNNISFSVNKGCSVGFIGPNGAGKTSTIKSILGFIKPFSGTITINAGKAGPTTSLKKESKMLIGYLPELTYYYDFLTPKELLLSYGRIFNIEKKILLERIEKLLLLVDLKDHKNKLISTFSKGMMQRIGLAQALINDPELLILDEPASGLDPLGRIMVRNILHDLKKQGKTIFFSSHELSEVELITDEICILNKGRIIAHGSQKELLGDTNQNLERFFLNLIQEDIKT